ncbi:hypothetical protein DMUE_5569 [Dictyocoela muelleri]|nr:hypothetical protein DMUE_5569 [Dictyocoela muelleri]
MDVRNCRNRYNQICYQGCLRQKKKETLKIKILKIVKPNTIIRTVKAKAYTSLDEIELIYFDVYHKKILYTRILAVTPKLLRVYRSFFKKKKHIECGIARNSKK